MLIYESTPSALGSSRTLRLESILRRRMGAGHNSQGSHSEIIEAQPPARYARLICLCTCHVPDILYT